MTFLFSATARTISPGLELLIRRFTREPDPPPEPHCTVWVLILVSDEFFDTRVSTRIFLINGKYPYTNVRILRPGFVTQGFDSRCVVSSIVLKSRKSRRGSRARADATHRRSAAILAPLHISRDRNTGESVIVLACARRIARVAPGTCVAGDVPSRRTRRSEASRVSSFEMSPRDGPGSRRSRGRSDVYIA